jgi:hypothetical protein
MNISNNIIKFNSIHDIAKYITNLEEKKGENVSVRMMTGNGDKQYFKDVNELEKNIKDRSIYIPKKSVFLYFGDVANREKPDIGYAFQYLAKIRPDINIIMIQIKEMEKYGVPNFVNTGYYFHNNFDEKHKWGGFEKINGKYKVYSNTKQWLKLYFLLHKLGKKRSIEVVDVYGTGGNITKQELNLIDLINNYVNKTNKLNHIIVNNFELEPLIKI